MSPRTALLAAVTASIGSVLPIFLVGAMSAHLRADLGLSASQLGLAALCYFLSAAGGAAVLSRVVERVGARRGLLLAGTGSAVAMGGFGVSVAMWPVALAFLALAGLANATAHPAANLLLAQSIPPERRGVAFGLKQAAIPAATLIGGLFVPLFALTVGWRWSFAGGAALAVFGGYLVRRCPQEQNRVSRRRRSREGDVALRPLLVMGLGAGLASAAAISAGTFYMGAATSGGMSPSRAALLFAGGSIAGIVVRIVAGVLADRQPARYLLQVGAMMAIGGAGFLLLSASSWLALILGTLLIFGAGFGWQGLFVFSIVRQSPAAPASATGITQMMVSLGSALGPPACGWVIDTWSYAAAWRVCALAALVASALMLVGRQLALSDRRRLVAAQPLPCGAS